MFKNISSLFCNKNSKISSESAEKLASKQKFLNNLLKHSSIISAEIYSHKIRTHSLKDYVVYKIQVKTSEIEFKLKKRFNEFFLLKEKIIKENPDFKQEETFPSKKLFGNFNPETLSFRKSRLNSFLQDVLKLQKDAKTADLILFNFFQLDEAYLKSNYDFALFSFKDDIKNLSLTDDDRNLLELLYILNKDTENMISNFSKFQEFFEKSPKLSLQVIQIFFKGYSSIKGIISLSGYLNHSDSYLHLSCCSCLKLLCFLMDYEENPNAEVFHEVFAGLSSREFASMGLAFHIMESPSKICKKSSLKLLDIYKGSNPNTNSFLFGQILDSDEAYDVFRRWKSSLTIVSQKTESFSLDLIDDSINLSEETKIESRKLLRFSSCFYDSKPKSGLFKRKIQNKFSPLSVKQK